MPATAAAIIPATPTVAGWVVLAIGALRLAVPQGDIRRIELVGDLSLPETAAGVEIGWLLNNDAAAWPAYSLDERLALERSVPSVRRLCVFLGTGAAVRGVLCDHVWSLAADNDLTPEPLAGCFNGPRSPVMGLARFETSVALISSGRALTEYLIDISEIEHGRNS